MFDPIDAALDLCWKEYWEKKRDLEAQYEFLIEMTKGAILAGKCVTEAVYVKPSKIVDQTALMMQIAGTEMVNEDIYDQRLSVKKVKKLLQSKGMEIPMKERSAYARPPKEGDVDV